MSSSSIISQPSNANETVEEQSASSSTETLPPQAAGGTVASFGKVRINRRRQEGNPIIKFIRNVPYEFVNELRPDFECTPNTGVLFLSLRFHKLHPAYIETRVGDLGGYTLRILLLLQDVEEPSFLLRDMNMLCFRLGFSLVLCYSHEEAAEYVENFRLCEKKSPEAAIAAIKKYRKDKLGLGSTDVEKTKQEQLFDQAIEFLSSIRSITKTDARRLLCTFGSIRAIATANREHLEGCIGLGPRKAEEIVKFFHAKLTLD